MTILPPFKKKRERDGTTKPTSSALLGPGDHRQNSVAQSAGGLRRIRKSPRPTEMAAPLMKRAAPSSSSNHSQNNNSDDEYDVNAARDADENSLELEKEFSERLALRGLIIKEMVGDGACMFRAIAEQLYGDQEMHPQVRKLCMDYMAENRDYFADFITEDFDHYILRKRDDAVHGNHAELQAISEMFARPVEVYQYSDEPINTLLPRASGEETQPSSSSTNHQNPHQNPPLRLSYHGGVHYNAIVDPQVATIGVGLGLPGLVPGGADRELLTSALKSSEREQIEETMLKDKIDMTDWQRTQADMEDQITRESYMSYLREVETPRDSKTVEVDDKEEEKNAPSTSGGSKSSDETVKEGGAGLYEELLAAQTYQWDSYNDDVAMAEALLVSQQDFMASQSGSGPSSSSKSDHKK